MRCAASRVRAAAAVVSITFVLQRCASQPVECSAEKLALCRVCNEPVSHLHLHECSPCRPYLNCTRVCHIGEEYTALPSDTRCTFGSKRVMLDRSTHSTMSSGYNHKALLPALNAARPISAASFTADRTIDVGHDAVAEYKIIDAKPLLKGFLELYRTRIRSQAAALADRLMEFVLPHIHVAGRRLKPTDLVYYGFNIDRGAYYPDLHWDTDWNMFPNAAGFQLWFMMEEPDPALMGTWGNMFLVQTPELTPSDPPLWIRVNEDGSMTKNMHFMQDMSMQPLKGYARWQDANLTFEYLQPKPGEVLVFSKRTIHFSDPRPHLAKLPVDRLVMNMRIIIRDVHGVPFRPQHPYINSLPRRLKRSWTTFAGGLNHMQGLSKYDWLFGVGSGVSLGPPSKFQLTGQHLDGLSSACLGWPVNRTGDGESSKGLPGQSWAMGRRMGRRSARNAGGY